MYTKAAVGCLLVVVVAAVATIGIFYFRTKGNDEIDDSRFLTQKDFEAGRSESFKPGLRVASEYNNGLFEGDIVLKKGVKGLQSEGVTRDQTWPGGVVPYELDRSLFTDYQRSMLANAFEDITQRTCIKFRPRTSQDANFYIRITIGGGCSSYVGRTDFENGQPVSLGKGCWNPGTIRHELMHALGFHHEQSRTDRDRYVRIIYDNIIRNEEHNYEKSNYWEVTKLGTEYDFRSVMHYDPYAFARDNSKPTIVKIDGSLFETQREGYSETDILEINKLYNCTNARGRTTTPTTRSTRGRITATTTTSVPTWFPRRSTRKPLPGKSTTFLNNEYIYVRLSKTWTAAEQECISWGGHLASFLSEEEKEMILSLSDNSRVWIGYKYGGRGRGWSDGSSNAYIQSVTSGFSPSTNSEWSCASLEGLRPINMNAYCEENRSFVCKR
uniref:Metalloendopeptidase n=1 Tax=Plectus sambesii TaxID=2011161 RepID=A0A914XDT3_9BILA